MEKLIKAIKSEFTDFDNVTIQKFRDEFLILWDANDPSYDEPWVERKKKESIKSAQERILDDDEVFESFILDTPKIKNEILRIARKICEEICCENL